MSWKTLLEVISILGCLVQYSVVHFSTDNFSLEDVNVYNIF